MEWHPMHLESSDGSPNETTTVRDEENDSYEVWIAFCGKSENSAYREQPATPSGTPARRDGGGEGGCKSPDLWVTVQIHYS